jgi:hypothetical protein
MAALPGGESASRQFSALRRGGIDGASIRAPLLVMAVGFVTYYPAVLIIWIGAEFAMRRIWNLLLAQTGRQSG